jgi:Family of unknown function (DUF6459)
MPPSPPARSGKPASWTSRPAPDTVLPLVPGFARPPAPGRPLPDAAAVRLLPVPDSAPPYDDESPATGGDTRGSRRLALAPAPAGNPEDHPALPDDGQGRPGGHSRWPDGQPGPPQPARRPAAASGWPSQFAQVLAETLAGARSQGQIVPWTTDQARRRIRQLGPMLAAGTAPRVHRIMTSQPADSVVEMTVVVGFGPRIRALAVRLERDGPHQPRPGRAAHEARWVCTVIEAA